MTKMARPIPACETTARGSFSQLLRRKAKLEADIAKLERALVAVEERNIGWYLEHTMCRQSMRALARRYGVHPSTILRAIRDVEDARDHPEFEAKVARAEREFGQRAKTPKRVRMTRRKGGWRKAHPDAVIVARPSKWGNPYVAEEARGHNRAYVTDLFREWLSRPEQAQRVAEIRAELHGRDLACWCPLDEPCHADVLLEIANAD